MVWVRPYFTAALCLASAVMLRANAELPPQTVRAAYDRFAGALCVIDCAVEATDPRSGVQTRRDNRAVGVVVSPEGLVMTRGHLWVGDNEPFNIRVTVRRDGQLEEHAALLLDKPEDVNVVFLRIQDAAGSFPYIRFSEGSGPRLGESVGLLGLLGETFGFEPAVLQRRIGARIAEPRPTYALDEPAALGFAGGPVFDAQGRALGVVGYDLTESEGGELHTRSGHPLLYQASLFAKYIETPPPPSAEGGEEAVAWLGVFNQALTPELAAYWDLDLEGGAVVATVVSDSPAARAGLRRGDVITRFNGEPVDVREEREVARFTQMIRDAGVGSVAGIELWRDGRSLQLEVELAARPKSTRSAEEYESEQFGLTVRELTRDVRIALNLGEGVEGVIVRQVEPGGWAALAGIRPGVIIMRVGPVETPSTADFEEALSEAAEARPSEIPVFARAGARTGFFRLQPRWDASE